VTTRRVLLAIAALTLTIQFLSARTDPDKTVAPLNAAQEIAGHLGWEGHYIGGNWVRLKGVVRPQDPPLKAFNLPGYVWYAAAMWRAFPQAHRYIQIPVVILLTVSVAWFAAILGGPTLGLLAGLLAALDPFIVIHGPVWDDAVCSTALVWLIVAVAAHRWRRSTIANTSTAPWPESLLVAALAGLAALTRTEEQLLIPLLALCVWLVPALRPLRRVSLAATVGVLVAVTAWGIRNERAIGVFLTGSTHDGITLWESNGPFARQALALGQVDRLSELSSVMQPYWSETYALTEPGADAYFRHLATTYITQHPTTVVGTALAKLAVSVAGIRPERPMTDARNAVSALDDTIVLALAAIAVVLLARTAPTDPRAAALLILFAATALVMTGLLLIGPAGIRYWLTLRAALWIATAYALLALTRTVQKSPVQRRP
jgi:hypothetical protein